MDDLNVTYTLLETNRVIHVYCEHKYIEIWTELSEIWACTKSVFKTDVLVIGRSMAQDNIEAFKSNKYLGLSSIYDYQIVLW